MPISDVQQLAIAIGAIDPATRIASGEIAADRLDELTARLAGSDFFVHTDEFIPRQCVDGRPRADGTCEPAPNSSGGTFTLVVADALTTGRYRAPGEDAAAHAKAMYAYLGVHGYKVGGHDADHTAGDGCGCGAEDKLDAMLAYIRDHGDSIRSFLADLAPVDDESHHHIVAAASELLDGGYVASGRALRQAFIDTAGEESVETLTGPHHEVALVANTQAGTTLDRARLRAAFGDAYQAFNVDVAALRRAAEAVSVTAREAEQKFLAALYYNVAVAAVLSGPTLRVVVR